MDQTQIVFLLHGMGAYADGWHEEEYVAPLKQAYEQYPLLKKKRFEERFTVVPINYDRIFQKYVKDLADNAPFLAELGKAFGSNLPQKLAEWLGKAGALKNNFGWTHAADVLMYRGVRLLRERVCTAVADEMIKTIVAEHKKWGLSRWSVIAHSLGTAVVHDTLARITAPNPDWPGKLAFATENEQANVVMMVANVSKVLEVKTADEPYDAYGAVVNGKMRYTVAPGFSGQRGRICMFYLNARHFLDPFTMPSAFDPQQWPDAAAATMVPPAYQYLEVEHVHQWNVHAFDHYLKNPKVHVPLFRCLVSPDHISDEEYQRARDRFPPFGGLGDALAIKIRQELLALAPKLSDDWMVLGALWAAYVQATGGKP